MRRHFGLPQFRLLNACAFFVVIHQQYDSSFFSYGKITRETIKNIWFRSRRECRGRCVFDVFLHIFCFFVSLWMFDGGTLFHPIWCRPLEDFLKREISHTQKYVWIECRDPATLKEKKFNTGSRSLVMYFRYVDEAHGNENVIRPYRALDVSHFVRVFFLINYMFVRVCASVYCAYVCESRMQLHRIKIKTGYSFIADVELIMECHFRGST